MNCASTRELRGSYLAHGGGSLSHDGELLGVHVYHGTAHLHAGVHAVRVHQHLPRLLLLLELLEALLLLELGLQGRVIRDCQDGVSTLHSPGRRARGSWRGVLTGHLVV